MNKTVIILVIVAVALVGGYFLLQGNSHPAVSVATDQQQLNETQQNTQSASQASQTAMGKTYEITYTDSGYAPSQLTVKVGDTVTFKNESSSGMWTASAMHPAHMVYSGTSLQAHCTDAQNTSFDECMSAQPGESWSFTFTKAGTWGYHNHVKAMHFGKVIVE